MHFFILGVALTIGLILIVRGLGSADPHKLAVLLRWLAIGAGVFVGGFLLLSGRLAALLPLLPALLPFFVRWRDIQNRFKGNHGPSPGQRSTVETATLAMSLDHDTGQMDGEIRKGRFAGRRLDELSLGDVLALLDTCRRDDPQAAALLEGWLDRTQGAAWRSSEQAGDRTGESAWQQQGPMTRKQAFELLGLSPGASREEIRDAHRRLMRKVHPDLGGSTYLAARINEARDLLLGE